MQALGRVVAPSRNKVQYVGRCHDSPFLSEPLLVVEELVQQIATTHGRDTELPGRAVAPVDVPVTEAANCQGGDEEEENNLLHGKSL